MLSTVAQKSRSGELTMRTPETVTVYCNIEEWRAFTSAGAEKFYQSAGFLAYLAKEAVEGRIAFDLMVRDENSRNHQIKTRDAAPFLLALAEKYRSNPTAVAESLVRGVVLGRQ